MALLEMIHVNKRFRGLTVCSDLSCSVHEGEIVGLIGPNGAGKTTLFNLISGFHPPDNGEIRFRGENITGLQPHRICKKGIVRTFQIVKPFPKLTVFRNIRIGAYNVVADKTAASQKTDEVIETVNFHRERDMLPSHLTIGGLKRLEFARALATEPKLILLDEIMAGLNPAEQDTMIETIKKINARGITVFVIEHHMKVIMSLSHRIIALNYGVKIAEGTPEHVSRNDEVLKAYLGSSRAC
jgi:branched-chain amino acid transport system ATP-binding protein